jgi:hypothetical protein
LLPEEAGGFNLLQAFATNLLSYQDAGAIDPEGLEQIRTRRDEAELLSAGAPAVHAFAAAFDG